MVNIIYKLYHIIPHPTTNQTRRRERKGHRVKSHKGEESQRGGVTEGRSHKGEESQKGGVTERRSHRREESEMGGVVGGRDHKTTSLPARSMPGLPWESFTTI